MQPKGPGPEPVRPVVVLVVEDNEANRMLTLRQLEKLGYQATAVHSGSEALAAVAQGRYALVLMDCQMPGMDGFEATRAIREREAQEGGRIPIIAVTASATERDREASLAVGMDDFITKPVLIEALQAALERWLPGPRPIQPRSTPTPAAAEDGGFRGGVETYLLARVREELGEQAFSRFLHTYLAELPRRVADIRRAVRETDPRTLRLAAHTLKSTSDAIGASGIAGISAELEAMGREGTTEGAEARVAAMEAESDRVRDALEGQVRQP